MKKKVVFYLLILFSNQLVAQNYNLVPNPDFEDYYSCPTGLDLAPFVEKWSSYSGTADYYNRCAVSGSQVYIHNNMCGSQDPLSGDGYAGFLTGAIPNNTYREFVGVKLLEPLVSGGKYYVSFHISLADGYGYRLPMNKIGALFSTRSYDLYTPASVNNFAHVYTEDIVSDTAGWYQISGFFDADSAYEYMALGIFFDEQHISTLSSWQSFFEAYYYVDDVCVSLNPMYCSSFLGVGEENKTLLNVYPNPTTGKIFIDFGEITEGVTISVKNTIGQAVFENTYSSIETAEVNLNVESGIYFVEIIDSSGEKSIHKIILD